MKVNICWFRRDLRLYDNAALYHALQQEHPVVPIFIFDTTILDQLDNKADRRVEFIHATLAEMQEQLAKTGSSLQVFHGTPLEAFRQLVQLYSIDKVFTNHDYEPYATSRDHTILQFLNDHHISFHSWKDQVIFEKNEVVKDNGTPYTVFTPYSKRWHSVLTDLNSQPFPAEKFHHRFFKQPLRPLPTLSDIGFQGVDKPFPSRQLNEEILKKYTAQRDYPAIAGTSKMGVHLRFGTVSIRSQVQRALVVSPVYLNELIWRDFYQMILWHFPQVGQGKAFKPAYDFIPWRNNEKEFDHWCNGTTGYPIVDAGMRELNATGFMHNRVRMIVASFLSKHLLIDWRWGEAYFAEKLLDYDLAANNGGWQWAAGSGCDAAPYFRVFNPTLQTQKFDPKLIYIRQWVPELDSLDYPAPMIAHEDARKRCLEVYGKALKGEG